MGFLCIFESYLMSFNLSGIRVLQDKTQPVNNTMMEGNEQYHVHTILMICKYVLTKFT